MEIKKMLIEELEPASYNPRKKLKPGDPEFEKLKKSIQEYGYVEPIIWNKQTGKVVGGHQRLSVLKELGYKETEVSVVDLPEKKEKALNIALNKVQGDWDIPLLKDLLKQEEIKQLFTGFDREEIDKLFRNEKEKTERKKIEFKEELRLEEGIIEEIKQKKIYFTFSGGKDSSVTAFLMMPKLKDLGKDFELLFVDTGVEIPGVSEYVIRFAEHFKANLKILKSEKDFFQYYESRKRFPSPAFRDCIDLFINSTVDKYIFSQLKEGEGFIVVRGGRMKQTTNKSKGEKIYTLTRGKWKIRLLNPLFDLSDEGFDNYLEALKEEFGIWEGYEKGFKRTACWICPFQTKAQYEAIKKNLPMLWEILKRKAIEWDAFYNSDLKRMAKG